MTPFKQTGRQNFKIGAKSFLKSTKVFTISGVTLYSLGETDRFQFIVRVIIPKLKNNVTSKCNAHKLLCTSLPFFVFLLERCRDFNFFWRSKQLANGMICRAIIRVIEFLNRIVYDECTGALLKWPAKFWYQNRLNPWKADEGIGKKMCPKHKVDNFDSEEGKWSNFKQKQARRSGHFDGFFYFQIILKSTESISIVLDFLIRR